jgi:hypothetical protein
MELKGVLKVINDTQQVTEKFKKREVVLSVSDGKYNQDILIQFTGDNTDLVDEYVLGEEVVIGINIRGREWTSPKGEVKYFNTIDGWRIVGTSKATAPAKAIEPNKITTPDTNVEGDDDLPF